MFFSIFAKATQEMMCSDLTAARESCHPAVQSLAHLHCLKFGWWVARRIWRGKPHPSNSQHSTCLWLLSWSCPKRLTHTPDPASTNQMILRLFRTKCDHYHDIFANNIFLWNLSLGGGGAAKTKQKGFHRQLPSGVISIFFSLLTVFGLKGTYNVLLLLWFFSNGPRTGQL